MLDAFANFGFLSAIPPWIHRQMEKYVCLLYKIGNISSDEVPELRWMLFAQKSKEGQQLPPTLGTLYLIHPEPISWCWSGDLQQNHVH